MSNDVTVTMSAEHWESLSNDDKHQDAHRATARRKIREAITAHRAEQNPLGAPWSLESDPPLWRLLDWNGDVIAESVEDEQQGPRSTTVRTSRAGTHSGGPRSGCRWHTKRSRKQGDCERDQ